MEKEFPGIAYTPEWGNIFVRTSLKDLSRNELLENSAYRQQLLVDTMEPFTQERFKSAFLHQVISRHKPHIIIDAVNTATALAYQDLYNGYYKLKREMASNDSKDNEALFTEVERMLTTLYTPQIIRHIQILHASMMQNKTGIYIKIGTTGTGGMGLNIPYTHSEERPSRVLLSKSSLAGAHTMLLFLMGRTPGGPIIKEIKPAAAIAWKRIDYGEVNRRGKPIRLFDCKPENAILLEDSFSFEPEPTWQDLSQTLKSVYIDTGENGIFSRGEFETITAAGQMEFVTPEEIAINVILEIIGDSTGHDVLNALNNSIMGPTYRAGYIRHFALEEMERLQTRHQVESVAFENLGPPRLSKILYEAHLLKLIAHTIPEIISISPQTLADGVQGLILQDQTLRSQIISIGIPILLSDGKHLLRGPEVMIPTRLGRETLPIDNEQLNEWAYSGWVDLRVENFKLWKKRLETIYQYVKSLNPDDTSSRHQHGRQYWNVDQPLNIGKIAAWIFVNEDKGLRIKR